MIIELCSTLLHKLNRSIERLNNTATLPKDEIDTLYQKIVRINTFDEDAIMARIDKIYKSLNSSAVMLPKMLVIRSGRAGNGDGLVGVLAQNVVKPMIVRHVSDTDTSTVSNAETVSTIDTSATSTVNTSTGSNAETVSITDTSATSTVNTSTGSNAETVSNAIVSTIDTSATSTVNTSTGSNAETVSNATASITDTSVSAVDTSAIPACNALDMSNALFITSDNMHILLTTLQTCRHALLHAYRHTYRTFLPFTCYFAISCPSTTFIIDTLRHRDVIAHIPLDSTYHKYMNGMTLHVLKNEYGRVPSACTLVVITERYLVDYRIRPAEHRWFELMVKDEMDSEYVEEAQEDIEQRVMGMVVDEYGRRRGVYHRMDVHLDVQAYDVQTCDVHLSDQLRDQLKDQLRDLLRLREFIAKKNDENVNYVMTERQMVLLMVGQPCSKKVFKDVLPRCSPLVRAHIEDILLVFRHTDRDTDVNTDRGIDVEIDRDTDRNNNVGVDRDTDMLSSKLEGVDINKD